MKSVERFREAAGQRHCAWLGTPVRGAGTSLMASEPVLVFRARGKEAQLISADRHECRCGNPFDLLGELLSKHTGLTAIGYFGYDLKNFVEKLPHNANDDVGLPDCWFGFYDKVELVGADCVRPPLETEKGARSAPLQSNFTREAYRQVVRRAKEYIAAGDIYQVNLSQRFQCEVDDLAPDVYLALCAANPAPYAAYLDIGDAQILSSSPECFLHINGREVVTRPIKGTLPSHRDPQDLVRSAKDNAELVMITDLERNDLGRVCEFGSVHVPELVRVESYATVHHLVSTVKGTLRDGVSHVECLRACFPGGSITGAPKIRAMEIIDELEPHARGVYCGAIGFFAPDGVSQFNIAIRTAVQQGRRLTFHAGGGIVADSDPDAEYEETLAKAQGIINAIHQLRVR